MVHSVTQLKTALFYGNLSRPVKELLGETTNVINLNAVDYFSSPKSVPEMNRTSSASRHAR